MRVLGVDPGLRNMGWGVIETAGSKLRHVANGTLHSTGKDLGLRLMTLFDQLEAVVVTHRPDAVAIEQTFVNRDGAATLKLGQARGVALLALTRAGLEVGEYAPNAVKKSVVGVGHATKDQIDHMVRLHLPGAQPGSPDAADALAIAICHAHHMQSAGKWDRALQEARA